MMKIIFYLIAMVLGVTASAKSLKERVIANDPANYRELSAVHDGAGKMGFTQLIGRDDLATNFLYLHAGQIEGKSGIGHHFHHTIEEMYASIYVPAMTVQEGYLSSKLMRLFPDKTAKEIEAEATSYNYQIMISFDTEENRRKWVASEQHKIAWPAASSLAESFKWRGYDVMGDDYQ